MKNSIELAWPIFKAQVLDTAKYSYIHFDYNDHYFIFAKQNSFTVLCKIFKDGGADQLDFEANYLSPVALLKDKVVTDFELNDKVLKLASIEGSFDESGDLLLSMQVPETFDGTNGEAGATGRWVAGGYAFTDFYKFGDRLMEINVVDNDRLLAAANGGLTDEQMQAVIPTYPLLKTYHDQHVPEAQRGWRLYASEGGQGEIEIDPIGGYGFLPAGMYLELKFKKAEGSPATKVACDIWWGRVE